ncbi:hypothetical protein PHYPO_G00164650 [Pangasianodon hypophthalmus]|uniref:Uncharacterized protein n=1 Tax=Pangasianodon hypophthalmus TaxID=310915 RepID=A0A5N5JLU2_PANHP|nr:hypothetical protein PHYPO_G00164650 [Pangasianodon hypophthalmus]
MSLCSNSCRLGGATRVFWKQGYNPNCRTIMTSEEGEDDDGDDDDNDEDEDVYWRFAAKGKPGRRTSRPVASVHG